jgi:hypothetical protein
VTKPRRAALRRSRDEHPRAVAPALAANAVLQQLWLIAGMDEDA